MKLGFKRGEKGFTLIEIIIVLAVLGVLAAVVVPNVSGFLGRAKERAWEADRNIIQGAVDSWRTDIGKRSANSWPLISGPPYVLGMPTSNTTATSNTTKGLINMSLLYDATNPGQSYLKGTDAVKSAHKDWNNTTQTQDGSYIWYIDTDGAVKSVLWNANLAIPAEDTSKTNFQTDIYP